MSLTGVMAPSSLAALPAAARGLPLLGGAGAAAAGVPPVTPEMQQLAQQQALQVLQQQAVQAQVQAQVQSEMQAQMQARMRAQPEIRSQMQGEVPSQMQPQPQP